MPYPKELKELIKKVEATRKKRLTEKYPIIPEEEHENLLKKFHPDYKPDKKREVRIGKNKGSLMPNELVDLLEAKSVIEPAEINLNNVDEEVDVLVIGGGGAGAAAALVAHNEGANVLIVTKLRLGYANTMMAEGGIQAATKENDSPILHYIDTLGGGHFENIPELVERLVFDAPSIINWLENLGLMFNKYEDGTFFTRHGGGTSRMRLHSAGDMTGAEIMRTLRDEIENQNIRVIEYSPAAELLLSEGGSNDGCCGGAILLNLETNRYQIIKSKAVILATGGIGRLHIQGFETTNHYGATADGLILAYRIGCELLFMDAIQYHPTGIVYPEQQLGVLISEKFRGLGAQLVNIAGEQFVYPLEPRDIESAAIIRECQERKRGITTPTGRVGVWLDSPMIDIIHGKGTIEAQLPAKFRQFMRYQIDIREEPILIYPTLHYQNGGIKINTNAETDIKGLYAAGEVAGGIHGRNRLMGNSLLDILVFGRVAGRAAANFAKKVDNSKSRLTLSHLNKYYEELKQAGIKPINTSPIFLPNYTT